MRNQPSADAITPDLIQRHAAPLPRYTSYPTANHFTADVGAGDYRQFLAALEPGAKLSLYAHIPYCRHLCWYCGCSTKAVARYEPVAEYLALIEHEIVTVSALVPVRHTVSHIHWGGGSPDIVEPKGIERLGHFIRDRFTIDPTAEFAVEIDPRLLRADQVASFAAVGVNRVSIGVQDFDPAVQKAIGRMQSYEETRRAVDLFRDQGIGSINIDLVYGLPHQTTASVLGTIEQVLTLAPDRIAIFGYAHLPSRLKHQRLIDETVLPAAVQRFAQSSRLAAALADAGYRQIGLDHFARSGDSLATAQVARNFQGYTTDQADALLGLGASAISHVPQGYAQNAIAVDEYARLLKVNGLATVKGWRLTPDDRIRAFVIERLMCDFAFSAGDVLHRFGESAGAILADAEAVVNSDADGFVEADAGRFAITPKGRPFVRNICARFDAHLPHAARRRHALSV